MPKAIGPLLVLTGIVLLDIALPFSGFVISQAHVQRLKSHGAWGALLLGIIFALAFCPGICSVVFRQSDTPCRQQQVPAAISLCLRPWHGLPVIVFAATLVFGVHSVSRLFNKVTAAERFVRIITGAILILIGLYYIAKYIFYVDLPI